MRWVNHAFALIYSVVALLFIVAGLALIWVAVGELWDAVTGRLEVVHILESIGILAIALVALEIAQTVVEEEVVRRGGGVLSAAPPLLALNVTRQ